MKKIKMPDTFVIIFFVVIFASLLTYIVPVGKFEMQEVTYVTNTGAEKTRNVPVPGSFSYELDDKGNELKKGIKIFEPGGEVGVTNYVFEGLASGDKWGTAVGIVAFLLVVGGAFGIILKTGAVESGIYSMISRSKGSELVLIPVIFILFSLGGAVFGMGEEAIPFAMLVIPIVIDMGYDSITGILITYISTQIGFATSWMNPFSVAIAQGVSGVPVLSGAGFRIFMWIFFTAFGVIYTIFHARRVKRNPESSIAYKTDAYFRDNFKSEEQGNREFKLGHKLIILVLVLGMAWVVYGVVKEGYYLPEIATQFVIMGLLAGIIGVIFKLNNMSVNDIATSFRKGAEDMVGAALVIGMAKGIVLTGGAVEIDGVSEQIASRSGYLTRKMLPIPLKGLKDAFYSDAVAIGIFLEDMEREYKAYLEESRQPAPTAKEKRERIKEEITLNNKTNDKKMDRKEEIDSFLEEVEETEAKKEDGKVKSFFKWFGELF